MSTPVAVLLLAGGFVVTVAASVVLARELDRIGERLGFSEALLGMVTALGADAPEIASAVAAVVAGHQDTGVGVVVGSNVFNLAALLGVSALIAGPVRIHRHGLLLNGGVAVVVAIIGAFVAMDLLLTQVERKAGLPIGHIGIEAQIETAQGLINVEEICAASPRLETIILGPVDFSADMQMPSLAGGLQIPEYPGDYFHYVFMKILMAGRANNLQVIDGPYVKVRDQEGFRDYSSRTQILGFDGKWALHPDQVTILNEIFSCSQEQFDKACDVLEAYEKATTEGDRKGAVMFGDEMIDEASRKVAVKVVTRGERAGLSRSSKS